MDNNNRIVPRLPPEVVFRENDFVLIQWKDDNPYVRQLRRKGNELVVSGQSNMLSHYINHPKYRVSKVTVVRNVDDVI